MPPRYVYWTIIVDGQPTAFRSGSLEDIMPTFNRLKEKQPTAELKWWQNGQLWPSRHDAQDFMRARGERGRAKDPRQSGEPRGEDVASGFPVRRSLGEGGSRSSKPERPWNAKPEWKTRSSFKPREPRGSDAGSARKDVASGFSRSTPSGAKPEWKPKGSFTPAPRKSFGEDKPAFAPRATRASARPAPDGVASGFSRSSGEKPEWKPKGAFKPKEAGHRSASDDKPAWKPKGDDVASGFSRSRSNDKPAWKPKARASWGEGEDRPSGQARSDRKPEWKPKGTFKPKEAGHASGWGEKPGWKPKGKDVASGFSRSSPSGDKPAWKGKPSGSPREQARSSFRPKSYSPKDEGAGPTRSAKARDQKLDWKPKAESRPGGPNAGFAKSDADGPKRKWVPKAEYKKSLGIEAKKDAKWRPGGDHVDPKQKYKDAKKAKWGRFKEAIRSRSTKPRKPKDE